MTIARMSGFDAFTIEGFLNFVIKYLDFPFENYLFDLCFEKGTCCEPECWVDQGPRSQLCSVNVLVHLLSDAICYSMPNDRLVFSPSISSSCLLKLYFILKFAFKVAEFHTFPVLCCL